MQVRGASEGGGRRAFGIFLVLVGVGLVLRLWLVAAIADGYAPETDAADFDRMARSLAEDGAWPGSPIPGVDGPTAFRTPGYPMLLSLVYRAFGADWTAGLVLNAVIGAAVVAVMGAVAREVWGWPVALWATGIAAVHPTMILFGSSLQLEPLLMLLGTGAVLLAVRDRAHPTTLGVVGCGALVGLVVLTREIGFVYLLVVAATVAVGRWRTRGHRGWGAVAGPPLLIVVVALLVLVPWAVRNDDTFGRPVLSTSPPIALLGTYNHASEAGEEAPWIPRSPPLDRIIKAHGSEGEAEVSSRASDAARAFIEAKPGYVREVATWNLIRLFDLRGDRDALSVARFMPYPRWLTRWAVLASYVTTALALLAVGGRGHRPMPLPVLLLPVLTAVPVVLVYGMLRYRASFEPVVILLAAAAMRALVGRREARPGAPDPAGSTIA